MEKPFQNTLLTLAATPCTAPIGTIIDTQITYTNTHPSASTDCQQTCKHTRYIPIAPRPQPRCRRGPLVNACIHAKHTQSYTRHPGKTSPGALRRRAGATPPHTRVHPPGHGRPSTPTPSPRAKRLAN